MKRLKTLEELVGFGLSSYHVENDQNKTIDEDEDEDDGFDTKHQIDDLKIKKIMIWKH